MSLASRKLKRDQEYYKVLAELGILDDDDDWELYLLQEQRYRENLDDETSEKYLWNKKTKTGL